MKKRGIAKAVEQEILASYEQLYRLAITYVKKRTGRNGCSAGKCI